MCKGPEESPQHHIWPRVGLEQEFTGKGGQAVHKGPESQAKVLGCKDLGGP